MRQTHHRAFSHTGQVVQRILNFRRVHIQAAADDQVLAAPHNTHIPLLIHCAHIACDEVAVSGELLRVFLGHAPVTGKHIRPFDLNTAHLTAGQRQALVIHNPQTHAGQRKTHAAAHALRSATKSFI